MNQFSRPCFFPTLLPEKAYLLLFFTFIISFCLNCQASEGRNPIDRLKIGFFPGYLAPAQKKFLNGNLPDCLAAVDQVKVTPYTREPEKYYLMKALCSPKEQQPTAAIESVKMALRERASSSDILYAAALILSEVEAKDEALKRYSEAIWFNSFKEFKEKDFYFDLGTYQFKLHMLAESRISLEKSLALGGTDIDAKILLAEIAIVSGDRRNAILSARQIGAIKKDALASELLLRSLMVSADPVFHKREISEAANLAKKLQAASLAKAEVGVAAVKALLVLKEDARAQAILTPCLAANPADTRLQALDQQIKQGEALEGPSPTGRDL